MRRLRTVLLQHVRRADTHYDWLFEDPDHPPGPLVAFRSTRPWEQWPRLGRFTLTSIPAHRRRYLSYQGPLSDDRGCVRRVAEGVLSTEAWIESRFQARIHDDAGRIRLRVQARRLSPRHEVWEALCLDAEASLRQPGAVHCPQVSIEGPAHPSAALSFCPVLGARHA